MVLFNYSVLQEDAWWNFVFSWASLCLENNWFKTIYLKLESRMYPNFSITMRHSYDTVN